MLPSDYGLLCVRLYSFLPMRASNMRRHWQTVAWQQRQGFN